MKYSNTNAYGYPCTHNKEPTSFTVNSPCEHDTRRPHTSPPAPKQGKSKLCFGTITLVAEECRKCNEIESCEQKQSIIDYQKREIAQEAAKAAREKVLDVFAEVEYLHNVDEITYPDLYNEFIQRYKSLRGAQREQGGVSE
jgi:hypothetical protein